MARSPGIEQIKFDDGTNSVTISGKDLGTGVNIEDTILATGTAGGHNRYMGNKQANAEDIPFDDIAAFTQIETWMKNNDEVDIEVWRLGSDTAGTADKTIANVIPHARENEMFDPSSADSFPYFMTISKWRSDV